MDIHIGSRHHAVGSGGFRYIDHVRRIRSHGTSCYRFGIDFRDSGDIDVAKQEEHDPVKTVFASVIEKAPVFLRGFNRAFQQNY